MKDKEIIVGNAKQEKRTTLIVLVILNIFLCGVFVHLIVNVMGEYIQLKAWQSVLLCLIMIVFSFLLYSSYFVMTLTYWKVTKDKLIIVDSTRNKANYHLLMNHLFHTKYDEETFSIALENIDYIKIYPKEAYYGRLFGEPGYEVVLKIVSRDGMSIIFSNGHNGIDYRETRFAEAIDFLKNSGVTIIDKDLLLDIIRSKRSINEHLNRRISK